MSNMSNPFKKGLNTSYTRGNMYIKVIHDEDNEPQVQISHANPFMDLTDIEVVRDLCNELLEANE